MIYILGLAALCFGREYLLDDGIKEMARQTSASLSKSDARSIAILDFNNLDGGQTLLGKFLSEKLIFSMFNTSNLKVIERNKLSAILSELELQNTGAIDTDTAKQLGKLLGVDALLIGSITFLGDVLDINGRIVKTQTGEVIAVTSVHVIKDIQVMHLLLPTKEPEHTPKAVVKLKAGNVPTDGLIAFYPFNGNANDDIGKNNGVVYFGAKMTLDRFGIQNKAYSFNGNNSFIMIPPIDERSISMWINADNGSDESMMLYKGGKGKHAPYNEYAIWIFDPKSEGRRGIWWNEPELLKSPGLLFTFFRMSVCVPFADIKHDWHHIVVSWDGEMNVRIAIDAKYPDGYFWISDGLDGKWTRQNQSYRLTYRPRPDTSMPGIIGKKYEEWDNGPNAFSGTIDDVRLYNRALNDVETLSLYRENGWSR